MEKKQTSPKKANKMNLIFVLVVLVLAGALAFFGWLNRRDAHEVVALLMYESAEGSQEMLIPLDEDKTYDVETCFDTVHLQVKDGAISFVHSPCPDHVCEGFGWLKSKGAFASCIPNQAFLMLDEKSELTK